MPCPKCSSIFFDYEPRIGYYVCRERSCDGHDKSKNRENPIQKDLDLIYNKLERG
jgi:hypothetical protein